MAPPPGSAQASARSFAASRALAGGLIVGAGLAAYCNSFPGILVFDEHPDRWMIAGLLVIVASGAITLVAAHRRPA